MIIKFSDKNYVLMDHFNLTYNALFSFLLGMHFIDFDVVRAKRF